MSENTNQEEKTLSPEELKGLQAKRNAFYKSQIRLLKPEAEYHDLLAKIEEAKTRQIHAMHQAARIFAANEEVPPEAPEKDNKKD
jgi:uncharacterized protein YpiB (UPF0302 family)